METIQNFGGGNVSSAARGHFSASEERRLRSVARRLAVIRFRVDSTQTGKVQLARAARRLLGDRRKFPTENRWRRRLCDARIERFRWGRRQARAPISVEARIREAPVDLAAVQIVDGREQVGRVVFHQLHILFVAGRRRAFRFVFFGRRRDIGNVVFYCAVRFLLLLLRIFLVREVDVAKQIAYASDVQPLHSMGTVPLLLFVFILADPEYSRHIALALRRGVALD